jgi:hypothetical protein
MGVGTLPPHSWIVVLWATSVATIMWLYTQGVEVNMAASRDPRTTWWRSALCVPGIVLFATIETYALVWGWFASPASVASACLKR